MGDSNKLIKNIVFDLDGTLVHKKPHLTIFIQNFLESRGIKFSAEQVRQAGCWSSKFWENTETYVRDPDRKDGESGVTFWFNYLQHYYKILRLTDNSLETLFYELAEEIYENPGEEFLAPNTIEVLTSLQNQNFKMGVLSNRYSSLIPTLESFRLSRFFDCVYSAGELGIAKPNPTIFYKYLEVFGGEPEETIYVGDNYWLDVKPSKRANLHPVLLDCYNWHGQNNYPIIQDLAQLIKYVSDLNSNFTGSNNS